MLEHARCITWQHGDALSATEANRLNILKGPATDVHNHKFKQRQEVKVVRRQTPSEEPSRQVVSMMVSRSIEFRLTDARSPRSAHGGNPSSQLSPEDSARRILTVFGVGAHLPGSAKASWKIAMQFPMSGGGRQAWGNAGVSG